MKFYIESDECNRKTYFVICRHIVDTKNDISNELVDKITSLYLATSVTNSLSNSAANYKNGIRLALELTKNKTLVDDMNLDFSI